MDKEVKGAAVRKDKLGRGIEVGSYVVYHSQFGLEIGQVIKLTPKMVKVARVPESRYARVHNKYPHDLVVIAARDITWYLLKAA